MTFMNRISLDGTWKLSSKTFPDLNIPFQLPSDVHSALLSEEKIPDPYWADNEKHVQWVSENEWKIERTITVNNILLSAPDISLCLSRVDTFATLYINEYEVVKLNNMFRQYRVDIKPYLSEGDNHIAIIFERADLHALARAKKLPFPIPWAVGNNQIPHMNLVRKPQCHAGWDWGISLVTAGIYDSLYIEATSDVRLKHVSTNQSWEDDNCTLNINLDLETFSPHRHEAIIELLACELKTPDGSVLKPKFDYNGSHYQASLQLTPQRWWPAGYGEQPLYDLSIRFKNQKICKKIGFRELALDTTKDERGSAMTFMVNGFPIMAKGANWIPIDALPSKITPERYRQLLTDAKAANMNMIRVWGGGMYESDLFYELCDELGLLVWQDLMFACALYPSTEDFIHEVTQEVTEQVKRLKDHTSIALWCGDNEVIGAIGWYPESKHQREKYVVNYDRLNRKLQEIVEREDPTRRFWASSPCNGELDFGDAWHDDNKGDMHFWDVWHSGKSFDAYLDVIPRFCSEFGYQSWPSLPTVRTFAPAEDWNITSPTFENHQKNARGNSVITEMFTRYFRFPNSFHNMLYLSQVQQAIAIKTAAEFWRLNKPTCRGILYWQLNDCWPVSSWSSIEYTGRWKQLHYQTKRFFAPQHAAFHLENETLKVVTINDARTSKAIKGAIRLFNWEGECLSIWDIDTSLSPDEVNSIWELKIDKQNLDGFFHLSFDAHENLIENTWFPVPYKQLPIKKAKIQAEVKRINQHLVIQLQTDLPAFFVHLEYEGEGRFSDSSFTLLPNQPKTISYHGTATEEELKKGLTLYDLSHSWQ